MGEGVQDPSCERRYKESVATDEYCHISAGNNYVIDIDKSIAMPKEDR